MEDPEYRRLGDTNERMIRLVKDGDVAGMITVWESLTIREQRMITTALVSMVAQLRLERGDPPDAEYGPDDAP